MLWSRTPLISAAFCSKLKTTTASLPPTFFLSSLPLELHFCLGFLMFFLLLQGLQSLINISGDSWSLCSSTTHELDWTKPILSPAPLVLLYMSPGCFVALCLFKYSLVSPLSLRLALFLLLSSHCCSSLFTVGFWGSYSSHSPLSQSLIRLERGLAPQRQNALPLGALLSSPGLPLCLPYDDVMAFSVLCSAGAPIDTAPSALVHALHLGLFPPTNLHLCFALPVFPDSFASQKAPGGFENVWVVV